jgi:hypothetical protein
MNKAASNENRMAVACTPTGEGKNTTAFVPGKYGQKLYPLEYLD